MGKSGFSRAQIFSLAAYLLINALFVYKYGARATDHFALAAAAYVVVAGAAMWLLWRWQGRISDGIYFSVAAVSTLLLAALMFQFDPASLRVGRYPALHDWIARLLAEQFPYASDTLPSGFPFLFALALPFYFLGDLGLFQIFSFAVFALLIHRRFGSGSAGRLRCLLLLIGAPIFLYEIVTRSDLFSNMVMILVYLAILERTGSRTGIWRALLLGLGAGLILATRGVALAILLVSWSYLYRRHVLKPLPTALGVASGFGLMLAPFAWWNWDFLIAHGPFAHQTTYAPAWLTAPALIAALVCGLRARSSRGVLYAQGGILFFATAAALALVIGQVGWEQAIFGDLFDISYFSFGLPFLLLAATLPETKSGT